MISGTSFSFLRNLVRCPEVNFAKTVKSLEELLLEPEAAVNGNGKPRASQIRKTKSVLAPIGGSDKQPNSYAR